MQAVAREPGIDLLAFETVPCLKELRAISQLLRTEGFGIPAWISCSSKAGTAISHGEDLIGAPQAFHDHPHWPQVQFLGHLLSHDLGFSIPNTFHDHLDWPEAQTFGRFLPSSRFWHTCMDLLQQ